MNEYVIKGNTAVVKCSIPSFVADFVKVESWIDEAGQILKVSDDLGNENSKSSPISEFLSDSNIP